MCNIRKKKFSYFIVLYLQDSLGKVLVNLVNFLFLFTVGPLQKTETFSKENVTFLTFKCLLLGYFGVV